MQYSCVFKSYKNSEFSSPFESTKRDNQRNDNMELYNMQKYISLKLIVNYIII